MKQLLLLFLVLLVGTFTVACGETASDEPIVSEPTFFLFYTDG